MAGPSRFSSGCLLSVLAAARLLAACGDHEASETQPPAAGTASIAGTSASGSPDLVGRAAADSGGAAAAGSPVVEGGGAGGGGNAEAGSRASASGAPGSAAGRGGSGAASGSAAAGNDGSAAAGGSLAAARWVGRVDARDPTAVKLGWQGAGFVATLQGTTIAVKLRVEGAETVFFQSVIDGTPAMRFEVQSGGDRTITLASGLTDTQHRVELYRDTEGTLGTSTFLGFTSGTLRPAPASSNRRIEVVGDSISAGYGNLGSEPHPNWVANPACGYTAANSTWFKTYASIAGRALNAEVSTIARSGWGMYRDGGGNTANVLSVLYDRTLGTSALPKYEFEPQVDVVVINLGTNDWYEGDPGPAYETAYDAFLERVRSEYPNAWLFLTIGSMLDNTKLSQCTARLQSVLSSRAAAGDQKLALFDLGVQNLGADGTVPTGCDWHPNVADHERMAEILKQQLSSRLGW